MVKLLYYFILFMLISNSVFSQIHFEIDFYNNIKEKDSIKYVSKQINKIKAKWILNNPNLSKDTIDYILNNIDTSIIVSYYCKSINENKGKYYLFLERENLKNDCINLYYKNFKIASYYYDHYTRCYFISTSMSLREPNLIVNYYDDIYKIQKDYLELIKSKKQMFLVTTKIKSIISNVEWFKDIDDKYKIVYIKNNFDNDEQKTIIIEAYDFLKYSLEYPNVDLEHLDISKLHSIK